jgi:uncharacterized membrane protein
VIGLLAAFVGAVIGGLLMISLFAWLIRKLTDPTITEPRAGIVFGAWLACVVLSAWGNYGDGLPVAFLIAGQLGYAAAAVVVWLLWTRRHKKRIADMGEADVFE